MNSLYKVIKSHHSKFPHPIELSRGKRVISGRIDGYDGKVGDITTLGRKMEGLISEQIIQTLDTEVLLREEYSTNE